MKKLVYTVQGFGSEEQRALLESLLPEALRAYGSDGKVEADLLGASVTFSVPRNVSCAELEQSVNAVLSAHGMELLTPPGVRYYAYAGPKKKAKTVTDCFTGEVIARDAESFTLKSNQPHTWLMEIE